MASETPTSPGAATTPPPPPHRPERVHAETDDPEREHESDPHGHDTTRSTDDDQGDMAGESLATTVDAHGKPSAPPAVKPKYDPKDPHRPRRKKARRACHACQRAHLTCGDERPCQRCIKRGLADACQDGLRKKAKYLHDAPLELLRPILGPSFRPQHEHQGSGMIPLIPSSMNMLPGSMNPFHHPTDSSPIYHPPYPSSMPPPVQRRSSYESHGSPVGTMFQPPPVSGMAPPSGLEHLPISPPVEVPSPWDGLPFENNPIIFPYDIGDLQFDNQYGAMEFSMLAQMSDAVAKTPDTGLPPLQHDFMPDGSHFAQDLGPQPMVQQQLLLPDYSPHDPPQHAMHNQAFAITYDAHASPSTDASPNTSSALGFDSPASFEPSPTMANNQGKSAGSRPASRSNFVPSSILGKRSRDPSSIYDAVQEPYSYTAGFHSLTACLQRRFSPTKTLQIAKSLASIRPAFISCTQSLNRQDLIFMEKCFQRTLFEYDELMLNCWPPTLVCRRTGEVAAVNKEFVMLSGWHRDVLLGHKPNLNVNLGNDDEGQQVRLEKQHAAATTTHHTEAGSTRVDDAHQPVFIAELMDEDSVIEFYENFAKLAFGDARGSVQSRCKLLKYQTAGQEETNFGTERKDAAYPSSSELGKGKGNVKVGSESDMVTTTVTAQVQRDVGKLDKNGKIDCAYCWTVKRDVFDIPMLIIMNDLGQFSGVR